MESAEAQLSNQLAIEPIDDAAMAMLVDGLVVDRPPVTRAELVARAEGAPLIRSGDRFGLINLNGAVVAPRPNRTWRAPAEYRR